jgi:hypothetical protein
MELMYKLQAQMRWLAVAALVMALLSAAAGWHQIVDLWRALAQGLSPSRSGIDWTDF